MFDPITSTSPRKERLKQPQQNNVRSLPRQAQPMPVETSQPKPGVDGLPMATLLGAIIVGIIMWIGIFALGYAILNVLF